MNNAKKTMLGIAFTTVFFAGIGSASYYLGVQSLDTAGLTQLNEGITNLKDKLNTAESDRYDAQLQLNTAKTKLEEAQGKVDGLETDKANLTAELAGQKEEVGRLQSALNERMQVMQNLATTAGVVVGNKSFDRLAQELTTTILQLKEQGDSGKYEELIRFLEGVVTTKTGTTSTPIETEADVVNALNAIFSAQAAETNEQIQDMFEAIGADVAWLNYGPEYRSIINPETVFGSSARVFAKDIYVRYGDQRIPTRVIAAQPNDFNGLEMIWNGFGWMLFRIQSDGTQIVYSELSDEHGRALGMGWVPTSELIEAREIKNESNQDEMRLILWGSPKRKLAKAFIPSVTIDELGSQDWNISWVSAGDGYEEGILLKSLQNGQEFQQNIKPNASFVTPEELDDDYFNIVPTGGREFQKFAIQRAHPWKEIKR